MCKMQLCTRKPDGLVEAARKKAMHEHQCTSWCFHKACAVGGEKHCRRNCDAYVITYWIYKNKVPFTHGSKFQEV